ncbi:hypothetical protein AN641_00440 [Candidatus Epulonipiscioides gigas]|nr:hypothetical protein AN641_00440 [Epulopiscium sp. SCG-C07WGA-EpuloA2]
MKQKELSPTQHVVGHMNLDVPFAVEHHLTFDALVCLLLQIKHNGKGVVKTRTSLLQILRRNIE